MSEIVRGKRAVTPDTALRFAKFMRTKPEFWLNLQQAVDLWVAMLLAKAAPDEIRPAQTA